MSSPKTFSNRHGSAVITLPSDTEILITRVFDAPAELVFEAYTTPELADRRRSDNVRSTTAGVGLRETP